MFGWVSKAASTVSSVARTAVDHVTGQDGTGRMEDPAPIPTPPSVQEASAPLPAQDVQPLPQEPTAPPPKKSTASWGTRLLFDLDDEPEAEPVEVVTGPPAESQPQPAKESEVQFMKRHTGGLLSLGKFLIDKAADTALQLLPDIQEEPAPTPTTKDTITALLQGLSERCSKERHRIVTNDAAVSAALDVAVIAETSAEDDVAVNRCSWVASTLLGATVGRIVAEGEISTKAPLMPIDSALGPDGYQKEVQRIATLSATHVSRIVGEALSALFTAVDRGVCPEDWTRYASDGLSPAVMIALSLRDILQYSQLQISRIVAHGCVVIASLQQQGRKHLPQELHARLKEYCLEARGQCHLHGGEVVAYFEEAVEYTVPILTALGGGPNITKSSGVDKSLEAHEKRTLEAGAESTETEKAADISEIEVPKNEGDTTNKE